MSAYSYNITNQTGIISGTTGLSLSSAEITSIDGFDDGGLITGSLGSVYFSTGSLSSGSLQTGGTFLPGGNFTVSSNGSNGLPIGIIFTGSFDTAAWTLIALPNGTFSYTLTGSLTGSGYAGSTVVGAIVQLTVNSGVELFGGSLSVISGSTDFTVTPYVAPPLPPPTPPLPLPPVPMAVFVPPNIGGPILPIEGPPIPPPTGPSSPPPAGVPILQSVQTSTPRSYRTQIMQNYFDYTDVRTRQSPVSLEAQLLNMAAFEIEDLDLRITREVSQFLQSVPTNVDNGGVYYGGQVPSSFITGPNQITLNNVVGLLGSAQIVLTEYDDTIPVPTRISVDSTIGPIPFSNPIVMDVTGEGDTVSGTYATQYAYPGILLIPNKITFWVDQIHLNTIGVTVSITGQVTPQPAWVSEQETTTEVINITSQGATVSFNRWSVITEIAVRQLSNGVRLRAWSMPFNLPAVPDQVRPYATTTDRGVLFNRYWQIDNTNGWLNEMYDPGGFSNLEVINSYGISGTMVDVAVEPWTYGMFLATSNTLYYVDRREYQPNLQETGLVAEPLYGLQVFRDVLKYGPTTYVILQGTPYANAINVFQYRYTVNSTNSILPTGALGPINAGWRRGAPQPVVFPLTTFGDYQFELECQDNNGVATYDTVPFRNFTLYPLSTISTTTFVDSIQGMGFDSYGQLWLWNGSFAIPIVLSHDGYVLDETSSTIYVTEPFSSLQIS